MDGFPPPLAKLDAVRRYLVWRCHRPAAVNGVLTDGTLWPAQGSGTANDVPPGLRWGMLAVFGVHQPMLGAVFLGSHMCTTTSTRWSTKRCGGARPCTS